MARKKTPREAEDAKAALAARLRGIRAELYGEKGAAELAAALGVPSRTWYNYERGVTVPAVVLLRFMDLTGAEPAWLLHGRGEKYRSRASTGSDAQPAPGLTPALALALALARHLEGGRLEIDVTWKVSGQGRRR